MKSSVVVIGVAFQGRQGFADTRTGVYWETIPPITGDNLLLQKSLITKTSKQEKLLRLLRIQEVARQHNEVRWPHGGQQPPKDPPE